MKFVIEVEDFWADEEALSDALQKHVIQSVTSQIFKSIKDQVDTSITTQVHAAIKLRLDKIIDERLTELLANGIIIVDKQEVAIVDHIKKVFENNIGWSSPRDQIAKLAAQFGTQLKTQYDVLFANRIVVKLNEQGMLKDEVVKLLIGGK